MHIDQKYIMDNPSYSITNPIFFAYHSLIDLMLDHKITSVNDENHRLAVNEV